MGHSIQSIDSESSTISSIVNVNISEITNVASQEPSTLIPQIDENKEINNNNNELIPSYIDIEAELQRQTRLINELKSELNHVTNERNQIRDERDDLKERLNNNALEISRLRQTNQEIDRQNINLRQMRPKQRGRKFKKIKSKSTSITNKRGHRPTVPAKLRFRRQRTTHRTVYCQQRS